MKKITKLSEKMLVACACPNLVMDKDDTGYPKAEVGYHRCDYDGYRWWSTAWPLHKELASPDIASELDTVRDAFFRSFKDLDAMRKWCVSNAQRVGDGEYNAWYETPKALYKFRMITRRGDYNLYLHCFSKAAA